MNVSLVNKRDYILRQIEFHQLGLDLEKSTDYLTNEVRHYSVFGNKQHYDAYWTEINVTKTREKSVERLKELGAPPEELTLIETAKANSDALVKFEEQAMLAVEQGDLKRAQILMFNQQYESYKSKITTPILEFQRITKLRATQKAAEARKQESMYLWLTNVVVIFYAMLVIFLLYFVFLRQVSQPLIAITNAINKVTLGKTTCKIPYTDVENEVGKLARAAVLLKESLVKSQSLAQNLQKHKDNLEELALVRTQELTDANNELEEFAYRTSHDLRSPIISSSKLMEITQASINGGDTHKAIKCISLARLSLEKLEILIEDLLILTEVKNRDEELQEIDVDIQVGCALEKMAFVEGFKLLDIQKNLQYQGKILTKKSRFDLIVENLISNAIKYRDPQEEKPYIKISTSKENGRFFLVIEDNGLGIPKEQEAHLFKMFKRFHPNNSFGSGLGLYMIKKSAGKLNGEISYLRRDRGSMFRLNIPA